MARRKEVLLVQDVLKLGNMGDVIEIDIPARTINLAVSDATLVQRRKAMEAKGIDGWHPGHRTRYVSPALQAYAAMTTSADTGAVRDVTQLRR